ncbi:MULTISPECIES: sensor histidine kinase [unclassified Brevibacterium]|uniref:sensor histidine kinase n=1 Tax=unclassified Brevibacterium TaxID=2614124 RepID=UPI0010F99878|nr:sensor histidine kinase [Brevibacterium sp. 2SA]MCM1011240.1 sensor histidine kinase [Brevibacterium sp. XM4083]
MPRSSRAFSRRVLLSQLAVIIATLALVTGVFSWMAAQAVTDVSETEALATARTLASASAVREGATRASATEEPASAEITDPLGEIARDVRTRSDIEFVVITDDHGLRLTHPNQDLIGQRVSTSPEAALAGREEVTQEAGTLGSTVRAKVPIYSSTEDGTVVGEVSVGIHTSVLNADLRREFIALGSVTVLALGIGIFASFALGRRLRRETLGVGPEELAEMARDQGAVLRGLDDGVLGFDSDNELTLSNAAARDLLAGDADIDDERRRTIDDVPQAIRTMMVEAPERGALRRRVSVGDKILLATAVRVRRDGVEVGGVVTLRDETTMLTMARQLESVTAMAEALRAQRHEFANRLHTVLGLVDTGATDEAHSYLESILGTGPLTTPVEGIETITDPYLRAVLEAKGTTAAEAGVSVRVAPDSLVVGQVTDPEDVTLVLGNLIDNAVRAVVRSRSADPAADGTAAAASSPDAAPADSATERGTASARGPFEGRDPATAKLPSGNGDQVVEVQLLSADGELHGLVTDTGIGIEAADAERIFDEGVSGDRETQQSTGGDGVEAAHGHGLGLALCRRVAKRHGGRVWLVDGHDPVMGGASFGVILPDVLVDDADDVQGVS